MTRYKIIQEKQWKDVQGKLQMLNADIASATEFVREIERGNLDVSIGTNTAESELKTSLVNMRDQMKKYSLTEKQRNWVNEGLAKFVQILRSGNSDGTDQLADNIIRNLVVYLKANQGALFALNDDNPKDLFLEMEACYAYDRKKYLEKRIELGEGLAGQVMLEKSTLYMTDLPKDYIKITSGLGEASPRNILLVPLKLDEKIYGVVEMASFQMFQPYEIEFVERLGESIAASIAGVKNSDRTKFLLKETQLQAEQLKAQEEEVRQNLEELSSTQEAMERAMKEVESKEAYVSQILNTSQDIIYTVDRDFRMVTWNSPFAREAERLGIRLEKGMNAFEWSPDDRKKLVELYKRVLNGETFEITYESVMNGKSYHFLSVYAPIKSATGEIVEAGIYARNVTPMIEAQQESARLLREAQQQSEELKAQEEELRQNMEELSAIQEAMQRAMTDLEGKEAYSSELLNATDDLIYTVDKDFRFVTWNKAFTMLIESLSLSLEKGMNAFEWLPDYRSSLIPFWTRALNGETFQFQWEGERDGQKDHYLAIYAPVRSKTGEIQEAVVFAKNVGQLVEAQQESTRLLIEAQQQAEELKAQEEELRQNMEELSATQEEVVRKQEQANKLLQKFELVTKTTTEGLWDMEVPKDNNIHDNTPFFWADRFRQMLGYSDERDFPNVLHSWSDLLHADHKQKTLDAFSAHLYDRSGRTPYDVEYQLKLKDGSFRWFRAIGNTLRDENGIPLRVAGSLIDIQVMKDSLALQLELEVNVANRTEELKEVLASAQQKNEELKAQEEELRQNMEELSPTQETMEQKAQDLVVREDYMTQLLNISQAVIFTVDKNFKLVTWNEAFAQTIAGLGVRPQKGMVAFEWRPDNERQHFVERFVRVFNGETFQTREESKFDGKLHHLLAAYAPLRNKDNEIVEAAVFAKDITAILNDGGALMESSASGNGKSVTKKSARRKKSSKDDETLGQLVAQITNGSSNGKSHS